MRGGRATKPGYVAALAASGALLLGGGTGTAVAASYPTTITHDNRTTVAPDVFLDSGRVESGKRACEVLRVVKVIVHDPYAETTRVADFDLTSYYGAWATRANIAGGETAIARVRKRTLRRRGHRITCRADSVRLF